MPQPTQTWKNWSESVTCNPTAIHYPTTQDEIIQIVKTCRADNLHLRVVGSGHSFTPVVKTDEVLICLDNYVGVEHIDHETQQATVLAGTKIKDLGETIFTHNLAQENLGDIDVQSIAGAISTGTHGSGITLGNIATQVIALSLITADGDIIECSATQNRDIFKAAQISLGVLGIISKLTLQLVPAFKLDYRWQKESLHYCLDNLDDYKADNRNFEFFWIPHTDTVLAKFMNITDKKPKRRNLFRKFNENVLENGVLWLLSAANRMRPSMSKTISRTMATLVSSGNDVQYSHRIFATARHVKFQEMEYSIPADYFIPALKEIQATIAGYDIQVHFPIECRFVRADDIYLSPAYGRDSAYIAVHMFKGMEYEDFFAKMEEIFIKYEGRPHWGKMHHRTAAELSSLYPRWEDFQAARQQLDPDGFFLNDHLKQIFLE
jgi:FAD-linked oxidoreductase